MESMALLILCVTLFLCWSLILYFGLFLFWCLLTLCIWIIKDNPEPLPFREFTEAFIKFNRMIKTKYDSILERFRRKF